MIQAFRDRTLSPLCVVASSQGGHGGLKNMMDSSEEVIIFTSVSARESRRTPQSSEHSHTERSRESCVEPIN